MTLLRRSTLALFVGISLLIHLATPSAIMGSQGDGVVLVLSGGGTKGLAHIGVLKVLEEAGVRIDGIVGTSMGAIIGGLYACGYSAHDLERLVMENNILDLLYDRTPQDIPDASLNRLPKGRSGLFDFHFDKDHNRVGPMGGMSATRLVSFLSRVTGERFQGGDFDRLRIPFAAVATDLETGETVVLRRGNLAYAMRASMAIPGIFDPWMVDGRLLVDGGLVANLPVSIARELFPGRKVLAVNLSDMGVKNRREIRTLYDVVAQSLNIITAPSIRSEASKADLLVEPDVGRFGLLDPGGYDRIIAAGVEAARGLGDRIAALSPRDGAPSASPALLVKEPPVVMSVQVEGLPPEMARDVEEHLRPWVGKGLDMEAVLREADRLSRREDFVSVNGYARPRDDRGVDVVMSFQRRPPIEVSVGGYATNLHSQRWMSLSAVKRDLISQGDVMEGQFRLGDHWGWVLRYFSPYDDDSQWGMALTAREDEISPSGMSQERWKRYGLRALRYSDNGRTRFGWGALVENVDLKDSRTLTGPYLYLYHDGTDSKQHPTRGYALEVNVWSPNLDRVISRTVFNRYVPWGDRYRVVISGGLETGDREDPPHRAYLGDQEELYSLGDSPLAGDQAAWLRVGISGTVMQTWWGRLNAELFGTAGMVMNRWTRTDDSWEVGLALSIPGQFFNGRLMTVYDKGGNLTFGFSVGDPIWWNSPLP
ncbi:patatin-like phospholipase family protein [Thermanaerovibrio acidaminovorans]|uniref:patatin-like phospholipase family protein n=1 Tax=Thermanaerovibrio acidaminovorans TaxID=81462 RepID=UPI002491EE84|nr:patatin-like phospholipase family protein [Thermanaerovibrio acidaminovorans]